MENTKNTTSTRQQANGNERIKASERFSSEALLQNREAYETLYRRSMQDPEAFWAEMAEEHLDWFKPWDKVEEYDFNAEKPYARYFQGGKLNAAYNCLDRHLDGPRRNKVAMFWQGEPVEDVEIYTYQRLYHEVNKAANVLKELGVKKGDRAVLYLPMIPQLAISMLACARIGAIHCVVFSGLSAVALKDRIKDAGATTVITANHGFRSGKILPLKEICDKALDMCPEVKNCVVVRRLDRRTEMHHNRDVWWEDIMLEVSKHCEPEPMDATDPLFILYTSGSTAKPKGILHGTGGYLLYATITSKYVFGMREPDVHWCTADVGWITGHSYLVYGPLSSGTTTLMFEGVPNYPRPNRYWEIIEKFGVNNLYTAPTTIRAMMKDGEEWVKDHDVSTLRLLGSVGEPIAPKAWKWYYDVIGNKECPVADTWWQTETGGVMIVSLPGAIDMKPGSAALPFFGIAPQVIDSEGKETQANESGSLVIDRPWPGMMLGVWQNDDVFKNSYFPTPGHYLTGDGAYRDEDGYFWITGRIDDVMNVSGHRIGTAEVESALISYPCVAEAAVVGYPHPIKGEAIYAYVTVKDGTVIDVDLRNALIGQVREVLGAISAPNIVHFAEGLPKTRSGKIMRRILRKIAAQDTGNLGELSTLADPAVVDKLIEQNKRIMDKLAV